MIVAVQYLKTDAAWREVDLHPDIAEYLRRYMTAKMGLTVSHGKRDAPSKPQFWKIVGSLPGS